MPPYGWIDSFVPGLIVLLLVVAVITLVSGLDEFLLDLVYLFRVLPARDRRNGTPLPATHGTKLRLTQEALQRLPEKRIAIMIPAWNEANVIRKMIENTIQTLDYSNYHIFVGTYPNDPTTNDEVALVLERYQIVHRVLCPDDGPTNKADCLNAIYAGILEYERKHGTRFEVFVQHDAEDLVHPYSLKVFNLMHPSADMVQLPVFALETDWREFTGCHYVDEFCEHHIKSIPVREALSGSVPSAGVGCSFSRRALEAMCPTGEDRGRLFNDRSLTEDYDFACRLSLARFQTRFVKPLLERREVRPSGWFRKRLVERTREEIIATREYFPDEFQPAVRQKSRWILGISIQGWQQLGWKGGFWMRYMLLRDRKTLLTSQINVLGYVVLAGFAWLMLLAWLYPDDYQYPGIVERGTLLWYVILADTFFLVWRIILRVHCVWLVYGWAQGLWSAPRLVWGNLIGFVATNRAIWIWLKSTFSGRPFLWEKTAHVFPSEEKIASFRQRLGDMLVERKQIRPDQLEAALARQRETGGLLGEILLAMGVVRDEELFQALGAQWQIETVAIDPEATPAEVLRLLPRGLASELGIYPLSLVDGARLRIASDRLLSRADVDRVEAACGRRVELVLTSASGLHRAIERGYARQGTGA
jgi:adsorption protein B